MVGAWVDRNRLARSNAASRIPRAQKLFGGIALGGDEGVGNKIVHHEGVERIGSEAQWGRNIAETYLDTNVFLSNPLML